MSDFDLDWGMEHELHVDHDGGVDHALADDHAYNAHDISDTHDSLDSHEGHDAYSDGHEAHADTHDYAGEADLDTAAHHDDQPTLDEPDLDLPDWQLDTDFLDGHYDLVGADPHEGDMWSQFMTDMHEEINPYAAN
ncbi:hypothetical protein [Dactylosporangium matsuzakiense]|uniref:Uncharacterized protein n=1 Tax=Dactylosporangium matsuzakiense TaxID=53360 RepID=A0A9W6NKK0_9ACTN|nr:hypothetical protein [Dactylosporangium matsuzakiense]UWZ46038.1 hypothetical protein Dmats_06125 [Dactylosporangium matsuzakiense]GLL00163.1 hypothetical protein GCM10017581_019030 [Dactylosporangium matsuzakiense]